MLGEFSRTELLIGKKAMEKLSRSTVAVFGIGGVGTFAVEGLVRSGVGKLVLIDHDCIELTNINRQIHATHKTIGKSKVEVMKERIMEINPRIQVQTHSTLFRSENAEELVTTDYDYIVDAIDTVTSKIDLVLNAQKLYIPIISCMGAGNKLDATRFEIADIYDTSVCPLAKVMRRELRKRGVKSLKVVYSREEPIKTTNGSPDSICLTESEPDQNSNTRHSVPGSIAFVPSVAGLIMAGEVVRDLIGF